jgi:nucleoid-associated protein YgaU
MSGDGHSGDTMKKSVGAYSLIALVAAGALGATVYLRQQSMPSESVVAKTVEPAQPAEPVAKVEPPKSVEEKPAEQVAVAPSPEVKAPAPETAPNAAVSPADEPVAVKPAEQVNAPNERPAPIMPSFDTVRIEPSGEAIIAGRAEPDADVTVKWNGNVVGTTKANQDGAFVLVPAKPLKTGTGAMVIEMSKNGNVVLSEGSVIVAVKEGAQAMVAKVDPVAPTDVVQSGADADAPKDLQLTAVDYDSEGNIVFSGTAKPGSVVRFYVDTVPTGEGIADDAGKWSFKGSNAVAPGTHSLRADAVDATGKVTSRIEMPFLREAPATVAAAQVAAAEPEPAPVTRAVVAAPKAADAPPAAEAPLAEVPAAPAAEAPKDVVVAATPAPPAAVVKDESPRKLVIQPGNNLWKLSREVYGKGRMYTVIYKANRNQVKNPNRIYPGQILTAPKMK